MQFCRSLARIHVYSINFIRQLLRSKLRDSVLFEINRFLSRMRGSIPVGPSKRTARTSERNRDYKAFIAQLPTSGRSLLICIKIGEHLGAGGRAERKNGTLIRDQIMILRRSRPTGWRGWWWRSLRVSVSRKVRARRSPSTTSLLRD